MCVHNKAIIIMEICKLPTNQNICDRFGWWKGQVHLTFLAILSHILTLAAVTCRFKRSPAGFCFFGWKMSSDSLMLMPAPQYFFWEIGTHAFSNHIGHCGCTKVLFAGLAKHNDVFLRIDLKMVHLKNKNCTPLYRTLQTTQKCSIISEQFSAHCKVAA